MSTNFEKPRIDINDWISQSDAARIRGVSRQAIWKLAKQGRIRTIQIGGHVLVHREDIVAFVPKAAGRPKSGGVKGAK